MKITIEPYSGGTYTAENDADHINEIARMFKGLLVQVGYHPNNVDELFSEDLERWFLESETPPELDEPEVTLPADWLEEQAENDSDSDES